MCQKPNGRKTFVKYLLHQLSNDIIKQSLTKIHSIILLIKLNTFILVNLLNNHS